MDIMFTTGARGMTENADLGEYEDFQTNVTECIASIELNGGRINDIKFTHLGTVGNLEKFAALITYRDKYSAI